MIKIYTRNVNEKPAGRNGAKANKKRNFIEKNLNATEPKIQFGNKLGQ